MRNKNILKVLSLLAAVCIAAGCNRNTVQETTTSVVVESTTTVTTTAETTTVAEETDSEISASSQLEIDYVDDDGIIYYKNPTEWTYEKFYSALTINGKKIEAPLTIAKLGDEFSTESVEQIEYNPETGFCAVQLLYNNMPFAMAIYKQIDSIDDIRNEQIDMIKQVFDYTVVEDNYSLLKVNGIGMSSKKAKVKNSLGVPNGEQEWILIYDNDKMSFAFNDSDEIISVTIDFEKMKESK